MTYKLVKKVQPQAKILSKSVSLNCFVVFPVSPQSWCINQSLASSYKKVVKLYRQTPADDIISALISTQSVGASTNHKHSPSMWLYIQEKKFQKPNTMKDTFIINIIETFFRCVVHNAEEWKLTQPPPVVNSWYCFAFSC